MLITAAAAVLLSAVAGSVWNFQHGKSAVGPGPVGPTAGPTVAAVDGPAAPAGPALPTLPNGRFKPGEFKVRAVAVKPVPGRGNLPFSPKLDRFLDQQSTPAGGWVLTAGEGSVDDLVTRLGAAARRPTVANTEFIEPNDPCFSPDGRRVAWVAVLSNPDTQRVVVDNQPGPEHSRISSLTFSPDSKHFAYVATDRTDGSQLPFTSCVVLDGKPGPQYARIIAPYSESWHLNAGTPPTPGLRFSADSAHLAYVAMPVSAAGSIPEGQPGQKGSGFPNMVAVVDGREHPMNGPTGGPGTDSTSLIAISPDGSRVAWVESDQAPGDGRSNPLRHVVLDGKPLEPHASVEAVQFSADGKRLIYAAYDAVTSPNQAAASVVDNGVAGKKYGWIDPGSLIVRGNRLCYRAFPVPGDTRMDPSGVFGTVVDNGKEIPVARGLVVSDDGTHLACIVAPPNEMSYTPRTFVQIDGSPDPTFSDSPAELQFSPDGTHLAYTLQKWNDVYGEAPARVVVDGSRFKLGFNGTVIRLRWTGPRTLRAVVRSGPGLTLQMAELEIVAAAPVAPAGPTPAQVPGSPKAEEAIARLRKLADISPDLRRPVEAQVQWVYADCGDKPSALAASAIDEIERAKQASRDDDDKPLPQTPPETPVLRKARLLGRIIRGQISAGRPDDAKVTAEELLTFVKSTGHFELTENAWLPNIAAAGLARTGQFDRVVPTLRMGTRQPGMPSLSATASQLFLASGQFDQAARAVDTGDDPNKAALLVAVATAQIAAGDRAGALATLKRACALPPPPSNPMPDEQLYKTRAELGDATAGAEMVAAYRSRVKWIQPQGFMAANCLDGTVAMADAMAAYGGVITPNILSLANTLAVHGHRKEALLVLNAAVDSVDPAKENSEGIPTPAQRNADQLAALLLTVIDAQKRLGDQEGLAKSEKKMESFAPRLGNDLKPVVLAEIAAGDLPAARKTLATPGGSFGPSADASGPDKSPAKKGGRLTTGIGPDGKIVKGPPQTEPAAAADRSPVADETSWPARAAMLPLYAAAADGEMFDRTFKEVMDHAAAMTPAARTALLGPLAHELALAGLADPVMAILPQLDPQSARGAQFPQAQPQLGYFADEGVAGIWVDAAVLQLRANHPEEAEKSLASAVETARQYRNANAVHALAARRCAESGLPKEAVRLLNLNAGARYTGDQLQPVLASLASIDDVDGILSILPKLDLYSTYAAAVAVSGLNQIGDYKGALRVRQQIKGNLMPMPGPDPIDLAMAAGDVDFIIGDLEFARPDQIEKFVDQLARSDRGPDADRLLHAEIQRLAKAVKDDPSVRTAQAIVPLLMDRNRADDVNTLLDAERPSPAGMPTTTPVNYGQSNFGAPVPLAAACLPYFQMCVTADQPDRVIDLVSSLKKPEERQLAARIAFSALDPDSQLQLAARGKK